MSDKCKNEIKVDIKNETIENTLKDLRLEISLLKHQNSKIKLKLDEDIHRGLEMTKLLQKLNPFNRTKAGEIIFPGKKEMEFKLNVMTREILKLKTVLNGLKKNRNQLNSAENNNRTKSDCFESNNEDNINKKLSEELCEKYNTMKDTFDKIILEISKYRVQLDIKTKEMNNNNAQLTKTQEEFHSAVTTLTQIEMNTQGNVENVRKEFKMVSDRLEGLKSEAKHQINELNTANESYMDGLREKEYQIVRSNNLYQEKTKLTAEFKSEFNRVKEYFKKRLSQVEFLPTALQAVQKQMIFEKELSTSIEKNIEFLSKKLKNINNDSCNDSLDNSNQLLKSKNKRLKIKQVKLENILAENLRCCDEIKTYKYQQKSMLTKIKSETKLKISDLRRILKAPAEEYFNTIDKLQNQISKIEAYSCFENDQLNLMSSIMQKPIDALASILKEAIEQITVIGNLENVLTDCPKICL
ncbi:putative leucine-rich repeat-containing protein DDB_G0290503 [Melanaphis sacchari]|uniref:putative leucine-rich repeat-containing protein DDB_G0290503 n=1 Tax=Melanaphis sacchari TaxID=742174 RepID=UPI000DC135E2|nr:putative leucine-rich repeat-containing protein DDB_G0290503 [Melanaphis sacchari]